MCKKRAAAAMRDRGGAAFDRWRTTTRSEAAAPCRMR